MINEKQKTDEQEQAPELEPQTLSVNYPNCRKKHQHRLTRHQRERAWERHDDDDDEDVSQEQFQRERVAERRLRRQKKRLHKQRQQQREQEQKDQQTDIQLLNHQYGNHQQAVYLYNNYSETPKSSYPGVRSLRVRRRLFQNKSCQTVKSRIRLKSAASSRRFAVENGFLMAEQINDVISRSLTLGEQIIEIAIYVVIAGMPLWLAYLITKHLPDDHATTPEN